MALKKSAKIIRVASWNQSRPRGCSRHGAGRHRCHYVVCMAEGWAGGRLVSRGWWCECAAEKAMLIPLSIARVSWTVSAGIVRMRGNFVKTRSCLFFPRSPCLSVGVVRTRCCSYRNAPFALHRRLMTCML